ncbi:type II toxin-antitoxin system RelE/ParE family toxin [Draconibacterium halophilum]|uniref:Type II toxin-antitoxin system RelE/ParE family toxin n=1 Tax=Draconibacterium halophilum TaxID=2706887 RepID=A0A6C0RIP7_9BACT|nr:type II toxin-antitoxin system RelE/ParE family toxin [Draconibacterium halophilum]
MIRQTQNANKLSNIPKLKKLKGYKHTYRIRLGEYRIGIHIEDNVVIFAAFDHRADIYKYFP